MYARRSGIGRMGKPTAQDGEYGRYQGGPKRIICETGKQND